MKKLTGLAALCLALVLGACSKEAEQAPAGAGKTAAAATTVYTTNYPVYYFAKRLAGEAASIEFPAPADEDPAYWDPSEEIIAAYQAADLILLNGADFEKWVAKATLPESRVVDTSSAAAPQYIEIQDAMVHSHGPEGQHAHAGFDFNTWLDTDIAVQQVDAIAAALAGKLPNEATAIQERAAALKEDLKKIDLGLTEISGRIADKPLIASHPVYNYLARRYQWNLKSLHWEPGEMPEEAEWSALQELLKTHAARFVIWEGDPNPAIAARLKTLGLEPVVFYPLANVPSSGDYLAAMQENLARLAAASMLP
ncbi:MAG: zinc ABC transporter substrate-binding protein [Candidatus Hydrogenedentes bacterium]|nr:zinc ABC transporter substrate-binding protein [Candidatus Hydrogenedentota bacterium]